MNLGLQRLRTSYSGYHIDRQVFGGAPTLRVTALFGAIYGFGMVAVQNGLVNAIANILCKQYFYLFYFSKLLAI